MTVETQKPTCKFPVAFDSAKTCGQPFPCPHHGQAFTGGATHFVINEIEKQPYEHPIAKLAAFLLSFAEKEDRS